MIAPARALPLSRIFRCRQSVFAGRWTGLLSSTASRRLFAATTVPSSSAMLFKTGRGTAASGLNTSSRASHGRTRMWSVSTALCAASCRRCTTSNRLAGCKQRPTERLWTYNNYRPNTAIGGITPVMKLQEATG